MHTEVTQSVRQRGCMRTSRGRLDLESGQRLFMEYILYATLYVQASHDVQRARKAYDQQMERGHL